MPTLDFGNLASSYSWMTVSNSMRFLHLAMINFHPYHLHPRWEEIVHAKQCILRFNNNQSQLMSSILWRNGLETILNQKVKNSGKWFHKSNFISTNLSDLRKQRTSSSVLKKHVFSRCFAPWETYWMFSAQEVLVLNSLVISY